MVKDGLDALCLRLTGNDAVFEMLGCAIDEMLGGCGCDFSISPFGPGSGWFGCAFESESGIECRTRPLQANEGGFLLHLQPCEDGIQFVPGGRGLAWMCFSNEMEEMDKAAVDFDPAYLFIEGEQGDLRSLRDYFLMAAGGHSPVVVDQASLRALFGHSKHVGFRIKLELSA